MANNCQIPTPEKYVMAMLDFIGYKDKVYRKKILENSCGEGNILCEIVRRYIQSAMSENLSKEDIVRGLEEDIVAYETDKEKIDTCVRRLNVIVDKYQLGKIQWNINKTDFLKADIASGLFDYIVGNPPYITYHDMTDEQRKFLGEKFESCQNGRYDYCYAFIEKSLNLLNKGAKLIYLIPYSVIRNKFAEKIRNLILEDLIELFDYEGIKIFDDVISSSVVILCKKKEKTTSFCYHHMKDEKVLEFAKADMGKKWFFEKKTKGKRFGDYFEVFNSVATLLNDAYILKNYMCDDKYVYVKGFKLERSLIYPAVSARSLKSEKENPLIIFPYLRVEGKCQNIAEDKFKKDYPGIYSYLLQHKVRLDKRKADKRVQWFEYGRTQALAHIDGAKLIMSMIITKTVNVYLGKKEDIPYAGYFIKVKKNSPLGLSDAKKILESKEFINYVKTHGTPTTISSYRISVKEIQNYQFEYDKIRGDNSNQ